MHGYPLSTFCWQHAWKATAATSRHSWRYTCFCHKVHTHIHFCIFMYIDSGLRHAKGLGGQQGLSGQTGLLVFTPRALNLNHKSWAFPPQHFFKLLFHLPRLLICDFRPSFLYIFRSFLFAFVFCCILFFSYFSSPCRGVCWRRFWGAF